METEYKSHNWYFRLERTSEPKHYEFGMKISAREAERRIANDLGLDKLPMGAVVAKNPLERLSEKREKSEA